MINVVRAECGVFAISSHFIHIAPRPKVRIRPVNTNNWRCQCRAKVGLTAKAGVNLTMPSIRWRIEEPLYVNAVRATATGCGRYGIRTTKTGSFSMASVYRYHIPPVICTMPGPIGNGPEFPGPYSGKAYSVELMSVCGVASRAQADRINSFALVPNVKVGIECRTRYATNGMVFPRRTIGPLVARRTTFGGYDKCHDAKSQQSFMWLPGQGMDDQHFSTLYLRSAIPTPCVAMT